MKAMIIRFAVIASIITVLVLIFLALAGCAGAPGVLQGPGLEDREDPLAALKDIISEEMGRKKITGLSIAVADSQGILWSEGFGTAHRKNRSPFTRETISNIGSVSKLITAAAIMRLADEGAVDLDVPVSRYIPEFNPVGKDLSGREITVRMLLNHESGLESDAFHGFFLGYEAPADFPHTYRRAIEAVNLSGLVRKPYEGFSYCNLGYSLLGIIIERLQGGGFQEAVKELVFDPLGMDDSTFNMDEVPEGRMAMGYMAGKAAAQPYIRDMPAGSLNTTATDMGRFLQGILNSYRTEEGFLEMETTREMFMPSNSGVAADLDFRVGLTWWIVEMKELPGEYVVGHGGDLPPYHSLVLVLPERDLSVFIMVNSVDGTGSFSLSDIAEAAIRTFVKEKGGRAIPEAIEASPVVEMPEDLKADLVGYYASPVGLSEIRRSGGKLKIYTFNQWFDISYHADGSLTLGMKLFGIIPLKLPVFEELSITLEEFGGDPALNLRIQDVLISPAIKIEPPPIDGRWKDRRGSYRSAESEMMPQYTGFRIDTDRKSGFLCLFIRSEGKWSKFPLETIDASTARLMGTGRGLGGLIRVSEKGGREQLSFLNFDLVKK